MQYFMICWSKYLWLILCLPTPMKISVKCMLYRYHSLLSSLFDWVFSLLCVRYVFKKYYSSEHRIQIDHFLKLSNASRKLIPSWLKALELWHNTLRRETSLVWKPTKFHILTSCQIFATSLWIIDMRLTVEQVSNKMTLKWISFSYSCLWIRFWIDTT